MKPRFALLTILLFAAATISTFAVPVRYEFNYPGLISSQFTIDVPSGNAAPPQTVSATDIEGTRDGLPVIRIDYVRNFGVAGLIFYSSPIFYSSTGSSIFYAFIPGVGFADGFAGLIANFGIVTVDTTSVPDGGATAALLGLGVAGLALVSRKLA